MKTHRVDPRHVTLPALARGLNAVHECLDVTQAKVATIEEALGLGPDGKKVAGLSSKWAAFQRNVLATTSSIIACGIVYKIAILVAPGLLLIWAALSAAMLKGVF